MRVPYVKFRNLLLFSMISSYALPVLPGLAVAGIVLSNDYSEVASLTDTTVDMFGKSELHVTGGQSSVHDFKINLESEDAWVFFHTLKPSVVADDFLKQIKIYGKSASLGSNVRVVQYGEGAVIIPHPDRYEPLEVFSAGNFTGTAQKLSQYTEYDTEKLGPMADNISSFILKRGYMATFAENESGTGHSKCYIAQDFDLEVAALPSSLDNRIKFVRVFPWRWTSKKGGANLRNGLNLGWWYNWNLNAESSLDLEYVAIKQNRYWPGLNQDWKARGINHLLGYNEPDKSDQANISVDIAIEGWPELLKTGLRVGSPAVTDGGRDRWLYPFLDKAREKNYRVDFVAIHYYWSYWDPGDPQGAAKQFYNFLKSVHDKTGLPIWITEWNNGANWTNKDHAPSPGQQKDAIETIIKMLDQTPWVERYAIYNWVEDFRRVQWDDGSLTAAGEVYRDEVSPIAYQQSIPENVSSPDAIFMFNNDLRDISGNGNDARAFGSPTFEKVGPSTCLSFNGERNYLKLPPRSGATDAFSFIGWIRWAGGERNQHIFDFGSKADQCFYLVPSSSRASMEFVIKNGDDEKRLSTDPMKPNVWTHVAITVSGKSAKLYIDGQLVRESPSVLFREGNLNSSNNYIARGQDETASFFAGQIFEARFLSRELGAQEVQQVAERVALNFDDKPLEFRVSSGMNLSGSLEGRANGGKGRLVYSKVAGPEWLIVHPEGRLEAKPSDADVGLNTFLVSVQDAGGRIAGKKMVVEVRGH